ncbi:MAG: hypothetical protein H7067_07645 [Burkholderiales bacterium]|nr:hypothetical protein [Opitutaceae bacterium]
MAENPRLRAVETRELFHYLGMVCREKERVNAEVNLLREKLEAATAELRRARSHAAEILRLSD